MRILYLTDTDTLDRLAVVTDEWVQDNLDLWDMGMTIEVWYTSWDKDPCKTHDFYV